MEPIAETIARLSTSLKIQWIIWIVWMIVLIVWRDRDVAPPSARPSEARLEEGDLEHMRALPPGHRVPPKALPPRRE